MSSSLDCEAVSPVGSVVIPGSAQFHAADYGVNARVVTLVVFVAELWVQEETATPTLFTTQTLLPLEM